MACRSVVNRSTQMACIAVLLGAAPEGTRAQVPANPSAAETCLAANRNASVGIKLPRTAARLNTGSSLRIVAIGSSSTTGLWVLSPAATYPEIMGRELVGLRPTARVEIINSGRIGDTIGGMVSRFEPDVLAHRPDLVVWQLGTNDVAWGGSVDGLKDQVTRGIRTLSWSGADVILMDLQYTPVVLAFSGHSIIQAVIAQAAQQERAGLFSRFALMRGAIDAGVSPSALASWDGLHPSAAAYDCVGRALARAVHAAAR